MYLLPTNFKKDIQCFVGLSGFCSQYMPHLSDLLCTFIEFPKATVTSTKNNRNLLSQLEIWNQGAGPCSLWNLLGNILLPLPSVWLLVSHFWCSFACRCLTQISHLHIAFSLYLHIIFLLFMSISVSKGPHFIKRPVMLD